MADFVSLRTEGLDSLLIHTIAAAKELNADMRKGVRDWMNLLRRNVRQRSHKSIGRKFRVSIRGLTGKLTPGGKVAHLLEGGTRPHTIQAHRGAVMAFRAPSSGFARTVQHPGMRAQPFVRPALDASRPFLKTTFNDAAHRFVQRVAGHGLF